MYRQLNIPSWNAVAKAASGLVDLGTDCAPQWWPNLNKATLISGCELYTVVLLRNEPAIVSAALREANILQAVHESGLNSYIMVPQIIGSFEMEHLGESLFCMVRTRLQGMTLCEWAAQKRHKNISPHSARELGELAALFHRYGPRHAVAAEPEKEMKPGCIARSEILSLARRMGWQGQQRRNLFNFAEAESGLNLGEAQVFAHADLHWANIICTSGGYLKHQDGRFRVFDFEMARLTTPLGDIANVHAFFDMMTINEFQCGYAELAGKAPKAMDILMVQIGRNIRKANISSDSILDQALSPMIALQLNEWNRFSGILNSTYQGSL